MWTSEVTTADNKHRQLNNVWLPKWTTLAKVAPIPSHSGPGSKQLLTSCSHQKTLTSEINSLLIPLPSASPGSYSSIFFPVFSLLYSSLSVYFSLTTSAFLSHCSSPSSPSVSQAWCPQTDAGTQSDIFISDAVRRFWDSSCRFMIPEWQLALKQGKNGFIDAAE